MSKMYISGAITSDMENAPKKFEDAEQEVSALGFIPVNPMKLNHSKYATWAQYMALDIEELYTCEAIYMLPCWRQSRGAILELAIAERKKMKIIYADS